MGTRREHFRRAFNRPVRTISKNEHRRGPKRKERHTERHAVETEDEGGEDSQDESPATPTTRRQENSSEIAANVDDEQTRIGAEESSSSGAVVEAQNASTAVDNENSSSSSSEDRRPLLSRIDIVGTKRKAEVLSKESGKIGVTITTSSPTSPTPPPTKVFPSNFVLKTSINRLLFV